MTNDGIIEGHTENSGCSDLSPATYFPRGPMLETICTLLDQRLLVSPTRRCGSADIFGSGETRMQMQKNSMAGGPLGFAPPRSRYFMTCLALLLVGASVSYGQQFNGTVFDLDSGRIQVINGSISEDNSVAAMRQRTIDGYRRMNAELEVSIANMRAESEARAQLRELREQTELLRKIANE